jgi:hypothetical protein
MSDIAMNLNYAELLMGIRPKKMLSLFGEKVLLIWKALFLEKRVLVYSQHPSICSSFIHSLLALFPTLTHFKFQAQSLNMIESHYGEYGLPLRFFHNKCLIIPYFSIQNLDLIDGIDGYLAGTSNKLLKTLPKMKNDIFLDIDSCQIEFKNESFKKLLALNKAEKEFISTLVKKIKRQGSTTSWMHSEIYEDADLEYEGSNDWIRSEFYHYLKIFLTEMTFFFQSISKDHICDHGEGSEPIESIEMAEDKGTEKEVSIEGKNASPISDKAVATVESESQEEIVTDRKEEAKNERRHYEKLEEDKAIDTEGDKYDEEGEEVKIEIPVENTAQKIVGSFVHEAKQKIDAYRHRNSATHRPQSIVANCPLLKREMKALKDNVKVLRRYGIDFILEWCKTPNFLYWLNHHSKCIAERSPFYGASQDHLMIFEDGDVYYGELYSGMREGQGKYFDRDQNTLYVGQWLNDKRNGEASLSSTNNVEYLYDGHFKDNVKHGFGKLITAKERYVGTFKANKYEGNGILVDSDKNVYDGEFRKGFKQGMGKFQYLNGDSYTGEFSENHFEGKGQMTYKNSEIFCGDYKGGMRYGYGMFQSLEGDSYEGFWKNNIYNGQGTLRKKDGIVIEGEFADGLLLDGCVAKIVYPNGDKYQGMVRDAIPNGKGVMKKANGDILEGEFVNGEYIPPPKEEILVQDIQENNSTTDQTLSSQEVVSSQEIVSDQENNIPVPQDIVSEAAANSE